MILSRFMVRILLLFLLCFSFTIQLHAKVVKRLAYHVNLNDRTGDTFKVKLKVEGLQEENAIYQFASTAPGAYQVMDMGKYVRSFEAFDQKGKKLTTNRVSVNQWKIEEVSKAAEIRYAIADTWDTTVTDDPIDFMCGSSLENDHALINGHAVFGFPSGLQSQPFKLSLEHPASWKIGTALDVRPDGSFLVKNYDHIVDSPILLGRLTKSETEVRGTKIEIFTYSKTDKITSAQLLGAMQDMLKAAGDFIRQMPVKRYTFLYHFEDQTFGAWEHSYSSEYVFEEEDYTTQFGKIITDIAAHEFFHIITPLNIHSEVIERFNFVKPTPSEHLWLYEGVTEWASHAMQLRSGLKTLNEYLQDLSQKIVTDQALYDKHYSLSKIALTSYSRQGQIQYGNVYQRGALVAGLLDIRLLELSGGKRGLRELVMELANVYGPNRPFSEKRFFSDLVSRTYPEIRDFVDRYVRNAQALPIAQYYEKLGIVYHEQSTGNRLIPDAGFKTELLNDKVIITDYRISLDSCDVREGDEITAYNDMRLNPLHIRQFQTLVQQIPAGASYTLTLRRQGKEHRVSLTMGERREERYYTFEVNPAPYYRQYMLRQAWMKNL